MSAIALVFVLVIANSQGRCGAVSTLLSWT